MSRIEFALPDVGEGLTEATIATWLVNVGDDVETDQPVAEIETAKSVVEITSPYQGKVVEHGGSEGDTLAVGTLLLAFETHDAVAHQEPVDSSPVEPAHHEAETPTTAETTVTKLPAGRVLASPSTRRKARQLGVDLLTVTGTGPAGRVTLADVQQVAAGEATPEVAVDTSAQAVSQKAPTPVFPVGEPRVETLGSVRREIARTMQESWQNIPHVTEFRNVSASGLNAARAILRGNAPDDAPKLTALPILIRAVAVALRKNSQLNASLDLEAETVTYHSEINIGVATSSDQGLVVPVVRQADKLSIYQISAEVNRLAEAVRSRKIRSEHLSGGTFTVSNFGSYGTRHGVPIIKPPEVGIVGFGRSHQDVVAADGEPVVKDVQPISMSSDHRLIDGDVMGAFLNDLQKLIEEPVLLLGEV